MRNGCRCRCNRRSSSSSSGDCRIEECGLILPIGFSLNAGDLSGSAGCCCDAIGGSHTLLHSSRVGQYFVDNQGPRLVRLTGTVDGCRFLSVDLDDFTVDGNTACPLCVNASDFDITNPIITSEATFRIASTVIPDESSGCVCETGNYLFQADSENTPSFIVQSVWQIVPELITVGSDNYVRFTATAYVNSTDSSFLGTTELASYVSADIPIGSDLDIRNIGEVTLTLDDASSGGAYCTFAEEITVTPLSSDEIVSRNILNGTTGCSGQYKSCCEKWGTQVSLLVKPLECDLAPEEFTLTEVSPVESPRRWTGTAALSCGDTYQCEFICDPADGDECSDQFQLTFTPECGDSTPIVATITDCRCGTTPPTFTYTAERVGSSSGCVCCPDPCQFCPDGNPKYWQLDMSGFSGTLDCDCANLDGTYILTQVDSTACSWRYDLSIGGCDYAMTLTKSPDSTIYDYTLQIFKVSGVSSLVLRARNTPHSEDCFTARTLTTDAGNCPGKPASVTVTPL